MCCSLFASRNVAPNAAATFTRWDVSFGFAMVLRMLSRALSLSLCANAAS